jgi:hypothetical protein
MLGPFPARTVTATIDRSPDDVYAFVSNPENFPHWSFIETVRQDGDAFTVTTPDGSAQLRFGEQNELGVLDHYVRVSPELEVYSPMRVIANGRGSEVLFTVFRLEGMSEETFARDVHMVETDLRKLKQVLEAMR